jgi:hypothetical protein
MHLVNPADHMQTTCREPLGGSKERTRKRCTV